MWPNFIFQLWIITPWKWLDYNFIDFFVQLLKNTLLNIIQNKFEELDVTAKLRPSTEPNRSNRSRTPTRGAHSVHQEDGPSWDASPERTPSAHYQDSRNSRSTSNRSDGRNRSRDQSRDQSRDRAKNNQPSSPKSPAQANGRSTTPKLIKPCPLKGHVHEVGTCQDFFKMTPGYPNG